MAGWLSKQVYNIEDVSLNVQEKCKGGLKKMEEKLEIWSIRYNILIKLPESEAKEKVIQEVTTKSLLELKTWVEVKKPIEYTIKKKTLRNILIKFS